MKNHKERWWIDKSVTYTPFGTETEKLKGRRMTFSNPPSELTYPTLVQKWPGTQVKQQVFDGKGNSTEFSYHDHMAHMEFPRMKPYPKWPKIRLKRWRCDFKTPVAKLFFSTLLSQNIGDSPWNTSLYVGYLHLYSFKKENNFFFTHLCPQQNQQTHTTPLPPKTSPPGNI